MQKTSTRCLRTLCCLSRSEPKRNPQLRRNTLDLQQASLWRGESQVVLSGWPQVFFRVKNSGNCLARKSPSKPRCPYQDAQDGIWVFEESHCLSVDDKVRLDVTEFVEPPIAVSAQHLKLLVVFLQLSDKFFDFH